MNLTVSCLRSKNLERFLAISRGNLKLDLFQTYAISDSMASTHSMMARSCGAIQLASACKGSYTTWMDAASGSLLI